MKNLFCLSVLFAISSGNAAEKPPDKPWHAEKPMLSPIHAPTAKMPEVCYQEQAVKYLRELQSGDKNIYTIKANEHGGKGANEKGWLTWSIADPDTLIPCPTGGAAESETGMCWKELSDEPSVMSLVRVAAGTAVPHYHREMECYYNLTGNALTWAQGKMQAFNPGDYLEIPSKAIHYTPNTDDSQDLIYLAWFPFDSKFSTFKYHWPRDVGAGEKLMFDFVPYTNSREVRSGNGQYGYEVIRSN